MKIKDIVSCLESFAPLSLQESYDNSGLLIGNKNDEVNGALLCLDVTEDVIDEAIQLRCDIIIAHHPIIFSGIKRINGNNYVERIIIKAIKNNIAIYACHTNLDNVVNGVNKKIADKLNLKNLKILSPKFNELLKLETFVPLNDLEKVRNALFAVGAGNIGNYSNCSFSAMGTGTFKGNEHSNPVLGQKGKLELAEEAKLEVIFEKFNRNSVINALMEAHPYEEVAYYLHELNNTYQNIGSGMIGELEMEESLENLLPLIKSVFSVPSIRVTKNNNPTVRKIAFCGGSGSFLLKDAISAGADLFLSADFKYHQFFDADNKIVICDIGHYETEQFTPEIFYEVINKKFATFALHLSKVNTNPINYF